tara:strand:+ start:7073 stop:7885 length:813 start_codon:yes stop_codon:yes gene_type:complete
MISKTGERILPEKLDSEEEYIVYLRHLFVYRFAKKKFPKNCKVLEIGSGEGYGTHLLSQSERVKEIVGLDVDLNSIEYASKKYISNNLSFKHYGGFKIPFEDNHFNVVVSFQVVEHLRDDKNYICEIYRVLKKEGILILATPNRDYRLKPGEKPWNRFHVREYSHNSLRELLYHKFENIAIFGVKGSDKIQEIEIKRVKKNLRIASFDPFHLRNLIPESLKPFVIRLLRRSISEKNKNIDFVSEHLVEHYYIVKDNLRTSLDLIGVCKKK